MSQELKPRNANLAYSLDGYLWAISSLAASKIQIWCVRNNTMTKVKPPLQIINIVNGCEGYTPNLYIPAIAELIATMVLPEWSLFFLQLNFAMKLFPDF